jgi:hypothetical protein
MMNFKGFGREWSWPNLKVITQHSPGGTEKNNEETQSGYPTVRVENRTRDFPNTKQEC